MSEIHIRQTIINVLRR